MGHRLRYAWHRFVVFSLRSLALIGFIVLTFNFAPIVEARYFPVLVDLHAHDVTRTDDQIRFYIDADKRRSCYIASLAWFARAGDHYFPVDVILGADNRPLKPSAVYPVGRISTGPYTATLPVTVAGENVEEVEGSLAYYCHPGWLTVQRFGPVPIPSERKATP